MIYIDKSYSMKFAFAIGHMAIEHWETHYNDLLVSLDCKTAGFFLKIGLEESSVRALRALSVSPQSRSPFSAFV